MTGTDLLPKSAYTESWTEEEKAVAQFVGFTAEAWVDPDDRSKGKHLVVAPLGVRSAYLAHIERTGLDPIARQIYIILFDGKWTIFVSIDGLRVISEESKGYRGQTPPQWSDGKFYPHPVIVDGKMVLNPDGTPYTQDRLVWHEAWTAAEPPAVARVGVYKKGAVEPIWGVALWSAYGKRYGQWKTNGAHMLAKCAEAQAHRKAHPQKLSNLYIEDERDAAQVDEDQRDWGADLASADTEDQVRALYEELKEAPGAWNKRIDASFRAKLASIRAEQDAQQDTVVVGEGASA